MQTLPSLDIEHILGNERHREEKTGPSLPWKKVFSILGLKICSGKALNIHSSDPKARTWDGARILQMRY